MSKDPGRALLPNFYRTVIWHLRKASIIRILQPGVLLLLSPPITPYGHRVFALVARIKRPQLPVAYPGPLHRYTLLEHCAGIVPEAFERLIPEECHRVYEMLRLRVLVYLDADLEVSGVLENTREVCVTEPLSL